MEWQLLWKHVPLVSKTQPAFMYFASKTNGSPSKTQGLDRVSFL